jgi:hypothetical protein
MLPAHIFLIERFKRTRWNINKLTTRGMRARLKPGADMVSDQPLRHFGRENLLNKCNFLLKDKGDGCRIRCVSEKRFSPRAGLVFCPLVMTFLPGNVPTKHFVSISHYY